MTNLKKTLAVVLAFAMILSMGAVSTFAAYSDVEAGTKVSEAVTILSNLSILTGFEDGTFKPEETVTRAQMAAIICRMLGYEDQAQSSMGSTIFNDVAADHWASGYVNVAQAQQIINGYGDGNYGPEDKVTYEQAVKMIVSALGYDLAATAKGGYPTGYLAIASAEGITKNANGRVGDAAARGTIAVLVYNALEVRLMDQETWTTTGGEDEYKKTNDTILSKYLEVQKWEGIVTSTPYATYAKDGYKADTTPEFSLDANAFFQEYAGDKGTLTKFGDNYVSTTVDMPFDIDCSLVDLTDLAGKKVVAYIGEDEDVETGNRMVYAIAEKQGANKVTKINASQLVDSNDDDDDFDAQGVILYRNVGSNRINELDLESNADNTAYVTNLFVNLAQVTTGWTGNMTTQKLLSYVSANGGTIELISSDNDSKIDTIIVTAYNEEAVIEAATTEEGIISFDTYAGSLEEIDTEDEDELVVVVKDGALATAADLAANDTVSVIDFGSGKNFKMLFASSKTVTGMVDSYSEDDEVVSIAGEEYDLSGYAAANHYENGVADLKDKEGIFFLNVDGQIAWDEADAAKGKYGLVLAVNKATGISTGYEVQVVLNDGTVATFELNSKAYLDNGSKSDAATAAALADLMKSGGSTDLATKAVYTTVDVAEKLVFEVTVKNDKITKLKSVKKSAVKTGSDYDAESMSYGALDFDDNTIVFAIKPARDEKYAADYEVTALQNTFKRVEDDDVIVGKVSDFFTDGEGSDKKVIGVDYDNNAYGAVLGYKLATTVPAETDAVIITSTKTITYDDSEATQITGLQAGSEVTYTIYNSDETYDSSTVSPETLKKGDVILPGVANAEGIISDFETIYVASNTTSLGTIKGTPDSEDDIYYGVGTIDRAQKPTASKFWLTTNLANIGNALTEGITMRAAANYTLVDYTESKTNPEISKKSAGSSLFGSMTNYVSNVFIRTYEDKIVEVVVYRYKASSETITVTDPIASVTGEVAAGTKVALSASAGATIYYTVDGTEPALDGDGEPTGTTAEYTGEITIDSAKTVKAFAVKKNCTASAVKSFVYTIATP